jgi:hypothetical protein
MTENLMVQKWKKAYRHVYRTTISGEQWYYRALRMHEIRTVSMCTDQEDKELSILQYGVIHPVIKDLNSIIAGAAETLVLLISKVTDATEGSILRKVNEERDRLGMSDDYLKWKVEIIKSLNYTPEQVDGMTIDEFVRALVLSEEVQGRPLVASGDDDGTTAAQDETMAPLEENENMDTGDAATNAARQLRVHYLAGRRKRRKELGRN